MKRGSTKAGHVGPDGGLTGEQWKNLGRALMRWENSFLKRGVKLVFHNHVGTYVETGAETARLLQVSELRWLGALTADILTTAAGTPSRCSKNMETACDTFTKSRLPGSG
jgi:hypothetical protein